MGIALSEIPAVGTLLPAERRELARWLRSQVARGALIDPQLLQAALAASPFAPVTCAALRWRTSAGWKNRRAGCRQTLMRAVSPPAPWMVRA
jgi:hypothetical protein